MAKKEKGESGVEEADFDVEYTAVGASSTDWGGKNAGGKAKAVLRADLAVDRNMHGNGVEYGAPKKNSHMNNKSGY